MVPISGYFGCRGCLRLLLCWLVVPALVEGLWLLQLLAEAAGVYVEWTCGSPVCGLTRVMRLLAMLDT